MGTSYSKSQRRCVQRRFVCCFRGQHETARWECAPSKALVIGHEALVVLATSYPPQLRYRYLPPTADQLPHPLLGMSFPLLWLPRRHGQACKF